MPSHVRQVWLLASLLGSLALTAYGCRSDQATSEVVGQQAAEAPLLDHVERLDCTKLDYGIYWLGQGHKAQKAAAGSTSSLYSPVKPTVLYAHGWQPQTVATRLREDLEFTDPDDKATKDLAEAWLAAGWNVGLLYWTQLADEDDVRDAERKIWSLNDPSTADFQMRWRQCDGSFSTVGSPTTPVGELFFTAYQDALKDYHGPGIRLVGHSLGNQIVTRLADLIDSAVTSGSLPVALEPSRIALLDPWWSMQPDPSRKAPAPTQANPKPGPALKPWYGPGAAAVIERLALHGVVFERYQTSDILAAASGDGNASLTPVIGLTIQVPDFIADQDPAVRIGNRHAVAPKLYFLNLTAAPRPGCDGSDCTALVPSAAMSDEVLRLLPKATWLQVQGTATANPADDTYQRQPAG